LKLLGEGELLPAPLVPPEDKKLYEDALSALVNLGYPAKAAKDSVERARSQLKEPSLEAWIKEALRSLT